MYVIYLTKRSYKFYLLTLFTLFEVFFFNLDVIICGIVSLMIYVSCFAKEVLYLGCLGGLVT